MRHPMKTFLLQTHNFKTDAPGNKLCIKIRFSVMISNLLASELFIYLYSLPLRESALIPCHLRLRNYLFKTADEGRQTQIYADE
jgi:hypothetical protein